MARHDYTGFMLEEIREQNRAILDAVGDMQENVKHIPAMRADIATLKQDMHVIKAVIRDTNLQVANHEQRLSILEQA